MPFLLSTVLVIALLLAYLVALAFYPTLSWSRKRRGPLTVLAIVLIALTPLCLPATAQLLRLLAAMNAIALMVKLYDLHATCGPALRPTFPAYAAYLPNWLSLVWRKLSATPQPTLRENARQFGIALLQAAAGIALVVWVLQRDWQSVPFLAEHAAKALTFFLALLPVTGAFAALWRLAGGRGLDPMDCPLRAATPAEFWRRYNRKPARSRTRQSRSRNKTTINELLASET